MLGNAAPEGSGPRRQARTDPGRLPADVDPLHFHYIRIGAVDGDDIVDPPKNPTLFKKRSTCVTGPTDSIHLPRVSHVLDYEGELGDPGFRGVAFEAACAEDLAAAAELGGASPVEKIDASGGGRRVRFTDPDGFEIELFHGRDRLGPLRVCGASPQNRGSDRRRFGFLSSDDAYLADPGSVIARLLRCDRGPSTSITTRCRVWAPASRPSTTPPSRSKTSKP